MHNWRSAAPEFSAALPTRDLNQFNTQPARHKFAQLFVATCMHYSLITFIRAG